MKGKVICFRMDQVLSCLGNVMLASSFLWLHKRGIGFASFT
jgi:hypothetical protein